MEARNNLKLKQLTKSWMLSKVRLFILFIKIRQNKEGIGEGWREGGQPFFSHLFKCRFEKFYCNLRLIRQKLVRPLSARRITLRKFWQICPDVGTLDFCLYV